MCAYRHHFYGWLVANPGNKKGANPGEIRALNYRFVSDVRYASNGTINSATMLMIFIKGFTAGPAVSL